MLLCYTSSCITTWTTLAEWQPYCRDLNELQNIDFQTAVSLYRRRNLAVQWILQPDPAPIQVRPRSSAHGCSSLAAYFSHTSNSPARFGGYAL